MDIHLKPSESNHMSTLLEPDRIHFIVCCPRSGSTWLRFLLNAHPDISCGPEFSLFTKEYGLSGLIQAFRSKNLDVGFGKAMSEPYFIHLVRNFCLDMYTTAIRRHKPSASTIVDKSTGHVFHLDDISFTFPDAKFIFLIRHPLDVALSLCESSHSWAPFFPGLMHDALDYWMKHNQAIYDHVIKDQAAFHVIHYEDMLEVPLQILTQCYDFLGVRQLSASVISTIVEDYSFQNLQALQWHNGAFFRQGKSGRGPKAATPDELTYFHEHVQAFYQSLRKFSKHPT